MIFFFFNDTATTEIYTLSLHDALPIYLRVVAGRVLNHFERVKAGFLMQFQFADESEAVHLINKTDRKSTRLNSSHANISYAVFCLKKKKNQLKSTHQQIQLYIIYLVNY